MANEKKNQKSGKTTIATQHLTDIAVALGLSSEEKAGWTNYFVMLAKDEKRPARRLLVHTGKKGTNCTELVGFEIEHEGVIAHPCPPAKTMTQMIDFDLDEVQIKRAFFACGKRLIELAEADRDAATRAEAEAAQKVEAEKAQAAVPEVATVNG
jgi:hypothetical protein